MLVSKNSGHSRRRTFGGAFDDKFIHNGSGFEKKWTLLGVKNLLGGGPFRRLTVLQNLLWQLNIFTFVGWL